MDSYSKINRAGKVIISVKTDETCGEDKSPETNKILSDACEKRNLCIDVFRGNFNPAKPGEVDTIVELFEDANDQIKEILNL